jgi:Polyketide cyclase / dehydrase and lipid transport
MTKVKIEVRGRSTASPRTLYVVAKDSAGYPRWSQIGSFEHLRSGAGERFGVGSRRIFRTWPLKLVEEVVELVPDQRVSYIVHSGLPFRDYRSSIEFAPVPGGGASIYWHSSFFPTIPGTAFLCRAFMHSVLAKMVPALAAEAERLESHPGIATAHG